MLLMRARKWSNKGRDVKLWKVTLREIQYDLKKKKKRRGGCGESENNHQSNCVCGKGWQTMSHGPNLASQIFFLWIKLHGNIVCLFIYMLSRTASVLQQRAWVTETEPGPQSLKYLLASSYPGEGNGNPLQCSCLENPRDDGLPPVGSHRVGHN